MTFILFRMAPRILVLLSILLSASQVVAHQDTLTLTDNNHTYTLPASTEYLEDPSGNISIEQLLNTSEKHSWNPISGTSWSFGLSNSAYWLRLHLVNMENHRNGHFLELHYPLLDKLDVYVTSRGHILQTIHAGDTLPFHDRPMEFRNFLFKPELPEKQPVTIYLRAENSGPMLLPLYLWHEKDFYHHEQQELLIHGLYFGLLLVFALHNLMLFIFSREKTYLYYTLYITSFGLFQVALYGLGYQYIWPNSPEFQHYSVPLFMFLALFSALRFAYYLLQVAKTCPNSVYPLHFLTLLSLLLLASIPFVDYRMLISIGLATILVSAVIMLITSAIVWHRVKGHAGYFFIAWFIFLLAVIASATDRLGWTSLGTTADRLMQLGIAIQVVILSLALARQMYLERKKRIEAQRQTREKLEEQVRQRTEELEDANRRLDAISRTDGLTGLKNRRLFDEELERQFTSSIRNQTELSLAMLDLDHFKQLNDKYGHLVGDDFLRLISAVIITEVKRPMDTACRYGGEEFAIILPETSREGAAALAEAIRSGAERICHKVGDDYIPITISIGTATISPCHGDKPEDLIMLADNALYQAKSAGRNRVVSC